jgi:hypothetical protein
MALAERVQRLNGLQGEIETPQTRSVSLRNLLRRWDETLQEDRDHCLPFFSHNKWSCYSYYCVSSALSSRLEQATPFRLSLQIVLPRLQPTRPTGRWSSTMGKFCLSTEMQHVYDEGIWAKRIWDAERIIIIYGTWLAIR